MPLIHAVEHHFAVFLGRGIVTPAELRSRLAAVLRTARLAERPLLLFDLRDVALLDLAPEDVDELCQIVDRAGPAAKGALPALEKLVAEEKWPQVRAAAQQAISAIKSQ